MDDIQIELLRDLRYQFLDLQVAIYLDRLHEGYGEQMSLHLSDDGYNALASFLLCGIQDRINDIDVIIRNLCSKCSIEN